MKKMNKLGIALLSLFTISLASCADVSELYLNAAYSTSIFADNYYTTWDDRLANREQEKSFVVEGDKLRLRTYDGAQNKSDNYKLEDMMFNGKKLDYPGYADSLGSVDDPNSGYNTALGYNKKLTSIDTSFSYGVISKIFDGRTTCHGHSSRARLQLKENVGFGYVFPKELNTYNYIGLSLVGGADLPGNTPGFNVTINLTISLYKYDYNSNMFKSYDFHLNNIDLETMKGTNSVYLYGFYFDDFLEPGELKRAKAISVNYEIVKSDTLDQNPDANFGALLYEMLLPDSTWN